MRYVAEIQVTVRVPFEAEHPEPFTEPHPGHHADEADVAEWQKQMERFQGAAGPARRKAAKHAEKELTTKVAKALGALGEATQVQALLVEEDSDG